MFQYTREFVINEDVVKNLDTTNNVVSIEGVADYKLGADDAGMKRAVKLIRIPFKASKAPELELAFTKNATLDQKLEVRLNLNRATEASYANNAQARMSKVFQFEIPANTTIADAVKLINRSLSYSDNKYFKAEVSSNKIKLTGVDGTQKIMARIMTEVADKDHDAHWGAPTATGEKTGVRGHGTYELLVANNRLLTAENTKFASINKYEMPIPGKEYDLFELTYNSGTRNIGGSGVVGSYERSITKHRFWVEKSLIVTTDTDRETLGTQTSEIGKVMEMFANNKVTGATGASDTSSAIATNTSAIAANTTKITNIESRVSTLESAGTK